MVVQVQCLRAQVVVSLPHVLFAVWPCTSTGALSDCQAVGGAMYLYWTCMLSRFCVPIRVASSCMV